MEDIKLKIYKEFKMNEPKKIIDSKISQRKRPILFMSDTSFSPPTDVWETKNEIFIIMEIADMKIEDFNIQYAEGHLIVAGQRKEPELLADSLIVKFHKKEIDYGKFIIKIKINTRIIKEGIKARYREGMLNIILSKNLQGKKSKNISIPVLVE